MFISILADLSILMGTSLILFLFKDHDAETLTMPLFVYVLIEIVVGFFLFQFSVEIDGAKYDYRFLLYCFSLKYLGTKVTISSIFLISVLHVLIASNGDTWTSFIFGMVLIVILPMAYHWIKKIQNDFAQLSLLTMVTIVGGATLNLLLRGDFFKDSQIYSILILSSTLMIIIFLWIGHRIDEIKGKSEIDYLTGLKNSRRFYLEISRLVKDKQEFFIAMLDIDYFKKVNDTFGHLAGDEVLKNVSTIFKQQESPLIHFYRVGGEEFACIIRGKTMEESQQFLEMIRQSIEAMSTELYYDESKTKTITVSIGVSKFDYQVEMRQSLREADFALYEAKKKGRNQVCIYPKK